MRLGLIGRSLTHSWSPRIFEELFRREGDTTSTYRLYPLATLDGLREWVLHEGLQGFNVTIPYKQEIMPLLDGVDAAARRINAVNCVAVRDGRLIGYNTDAPAFRDTLIPLLKPCHTRALILGTGGASRAVADALHQLRIPTVFVSRNPKREDAADPHTLMREDAAGWHTLMREGAADPHTLMREDAVDTVVSYREAEALLPTHHLLVNTTPVGMYPNIHATPWHRPDLWTPQHLCYDLIYNPSPTLLLQQARAHHAATHDGTPMLTLQATLSHQIWKA